MISLSVVIITFNSEKYLDRVLCSLSGICTEIVILDSGSTDQTETIAKKHGARFTFQPFAGYGRQKIAATLLAQNDWILSLDSDEILDDRARAHLQKLTDEDPNACWRIRRRNHVGMREIRHGHWSPDWCLRLFNRTKHNFSADDVHESVHPRGPIHTLSGSILHFGYTDLGDIIRMKYHRMKGDSYRLRMRKAGTFNLAARALWAFIHSFVIKRGFLDGPAGVIVALSASLNATMGLALASWDSTEKSS